MLLEVDPDVGVSVVSVVVWFGVSVVVWFVDVSVWVGVDVGVVVGFVGV